MRGLQFVLGFTYLTLTSSAPVIEAPWGSISGFDQISPEGVQYSSYLGIPYALPPVGELRWKKPVTHPGPGKGKVYNATSYGYVCPQPVILQLGPLPGETNEDCLYLDVHVPATPQPAGGWAVIFWIHGGYFFFGSTVKDSPASLVTKGDVIFASTNYRQGILGFLSSGDKAAPGNYGLFDQNLAMSWVKKNVLAFGGDPNRITIFGHTGGAASLGYHLLSSQSAGLFDKAILHSGSPLATWTLNPNPIEAFNKLAERTGCMPIDRGQEERSGKTYGHFARYMYQGKCPTGGLRRPNERTVERNKQILECLRQLGAEELVQYTIIPRDPENFVLYESYPFTPVVDGDIVLGPPTELAHDAQYLMANNITSRDIMIGFNNQEGTVIFMLYELLNITNNVPAFTLMNETLIASIRTELQYLYGENILCEQRRLSVLIDLIRLFYVDDQEQVIPTTIPDFLADTAFVVPAIKLIRAMSSAFQQSHAASRGSLYLYVFDHFSQRRAGELFNGTVHADDPSYLLDQGFLVNPTGFTQEDYDLADTYRTMFTDFAKIGDPSTAVGGNFPEFSVPEEQYLSFSPNSTVRDHVRGKFVTLWSDVVSAFVELTDKAKSAKHRY